MAGCGCFQQQRSLKCCGVADVMYNIKIFLQKSLLLGGMQTTPHTPPLASHTPICEPPFPDPPPSSSQPKPAAHHQGVSPFRAPSRGRTTGQRTRRQAHYSKSFIYVELRHHIRHHPTAFHSRETCMIFKQGNHHLSPSQVVLLPTASLCPRPARTSVHTRGLLLVSKSRLYVRM